MDNDEDLNFQIESNKKQEKGMIDDYKNSSDEISAYLNKRPHIVGGSIGNSQIHKNIKAILKGMGVIVEMLEEIDEATHTKPVKQSVIEKKKQTTVIAEVKPKPIKEPKRKSLGPYTRPVVKDKNEVKVTIKKGNEGAGKISYIPRRSLFDIDHDINGRIIEAIIVTGNVQEEIPTKEVFIRNDGIEYVNEETIPRSQIPEILKKKKIERMVLVFDVDFK